MKRLLLSNSLGGLIFILFLIIYVATAKGYLQTSDSFFSYLTAKMLVVNHSLSFVPEDIAQINKNLVADNNWYLKGKNGRYYSMYGVGLPVLWVPFVAFGRSLLGYAGLSADSFKTFLFEGFLVSFYSVFLGAGVCVLTFRMAKFFKATAAVSVVLALLLGLTTLCWRYAVYDFSEIAQMFFLTLAVHCLIRETRGSFLLGCTSFAYLLLLKVVYVAYIPIFLLYLLIKKGNVPGGKKAELFFFCSIATIAMTIVAVVNYVRFGNILQTGYPQYAYSLTQSAFALSNIPQNVPKLLFSANKGIFIYSPILLLAVLGYPAFFKRYTPEAILFVCIIGVNLIMIGMMRSYGGDWSWGPRYLVPTLPLWLLPLCFLMEKGKALFQAALVFLATLSFLIQLLGVLQCDAEFLYIKRNVIGYDKVLSQMPSGYQPHIVGSAILLKHKLLEGNKPYRFSEFGLPEDTEIRPEDLKPYHRGLHLWYSLLARQWNKPVLHFAWVIFLPLVIAVAIWLKRAVALADRPGA